LLGDARVLEVSSPLHLPNSIVADSTQVVEKRDICATPLNYLMVISPHVSCISSFGKSIQEIVFLGVFYQVGEFP